MIACDGADSGVRDALGIKLEGDSSMNYNINAYFRSTDHESLFKHGPAVMQWIIDGEGVWADIVSVNGNNSPNYIHQFVDTLPASQARKIRIMYRQYMPKASVEGLYSCASCGHRQELEVPINSNFFWPDE